MRKNIWLSLFLILLLIILVTRCASIKYFDYDIGRAPLEIAPYREKSIELVNFYFANADNEYLRREQRAIERTAESIEEAVFRELLKGPQNRLLVPTIPPQTRLFSVSTVNGTTYINLSREFINNFKGGEKAEVTAIYSIVNSFTELKNVKRVQILVEGEGLDRYQYHLSLNEPYGRNEKIINNSFPNPIEVLDQYFKYIEEEEYRRAFDEIYRPLDYNLDYAMYFRYMRFEKKGVKEYTITAFRMTKSEGTATMVVDYLEELKDGKVIEHKGVEFQFKNDFGEWKIIYKQI